MYYRVITNITITQVSTETYPGRNRVINLDFVNYFECRDNFKSLTNDGKIIIPKNLFFVDEHGKKQNLRDTNLNLGGFQVNPLILRGDLVKIETGYKYFNSAKREITDTAVFFEGFITKVSPKVPLELGIEDNMWKLKQIPAPTHTFTPSDSLEDILKLLLKGTGFTYYDSARTTFGDHFTIGNETVAQVLQKLKTKFGFRSFFRGNVLHCGALIYSGLIPKTHNFVMVGGNGNVIKGTNELEYVRKDDLVLSAVAHNTIEEETGHTTKDGTAKTKRTRLEVLVTIRNGRRTDQVIPKGERVPENLEGERREFYYPGAKTVKALADLAYNELILYYYTGLTGSFQTFGIPFVELGDNVRMRNRILPELNGVYKVKEVLRSGGMKGPKQTITLDYRLNDVQ